MVMMSHLRAILQASPYKTLWRRFQIPRSMPARPCSLYTCTYKSRNRVLHPLWEKVDLAPAGERQSPINIRWKDSVYDPGLQPPPSLMTRPPASTPGITGTLSSWNLKILQINQVRARPVVSSGVKRTASCQHRPHVP
uniref:Carbonic anhydrase 5B n=1 Tax=Bos mutus grunniens TaxID=30521 RepID=A0A8B9X9V1_BOSMU